MTCCYLLPVMALSANDERRFSLIDRRSVLSRNKMKYLISMNKQKLTSDRLLLLINIDL